MNPAFVFDGNAQATRYVLNLGKASNLNKSPICLVETEAFDSYYLDDGRLIEIPFFILETNTLSQCTLVSSKYFTIYLGFYNSLYLQFENQSFLIASRLPCNVWHSLTIQNYEIVFNSEVFGSPFALSKKSILPVGLGQTSLKCLLNIQNSKGFYPVPTAPYQFVGKFQPIRSLAELDQWQPEGIPFNSRYGIKPTFKSAKNLLVTCHDSGSNYKLDIGVNSNPTNYVYFHFLHTDIFIYFSHYRISVPPVAWIECGHKSGSLVLGTFITENQSGEEDNVKLTDNIEFYADKLVKLMEFYGFDGYLINIEAKCSNPSGMIQFLNLLTAKAQASNTKNRIIWYDSMNTEGEIDWQNELNAENLVFLQNSDGFLTNYAWKEGDPEKSAEVAGSDKWAVYTGTDVFGRGTWGGGGYNTYIGAKDSLATSCCLFAPAWTYEKIARENFDLFVQAEKFMWSERVCVLIDIGGFVYPDRETVSAMNALNGWEVFITESRKNTETNDWTKVDNPQDYWKVTDSLVFIDGAVQTKRVSTVNLADNGIQNINFIYGSVQVIGSKPKYDDYYRVELSVLTSNGEVITKVASGQTDSDWKVVKLEIEADDIVEVTWTESGFDSENWGGFYGSQFRDTCVVYKMAGECLLDYFEEKTLLEPFCTWFSLGQGPKLWNNGSVLQDKTWNSLQDVDILPSFLVLSQFEFDFNTVYHGTNSLKVPVGSYQLFRCGFKCDKINVQVIYKGKISIVTSRMMLVKQEFSAGWTIDNYLFTGYLRDFVIYASEVSYLAGLHLFYEFPQFTFTDFSWDAHWNLGSLDSENEVFDLVGSFQDLPETIRYVNVFMNKEFAGRIYSKDFCLSGLSGSSKTYYFDFVAENLNGTVSAVYSFSCSYRKLKANSPFYSNYELLS